jgi:hypothetical protein
MNNQDELAQGHSHLNKRNGPSRRASEAAEDAHGPLSTAVLETIKMRDDDLTAWCGPIAKLPADRFAAALLIALDLREQFSQDRLSSFAKGLRVNVSAL